VASDLVEAELELFAGLSSWRKLLISVSFRRRRRIGSFNSLSEGKVHHAFNEIVDPQFSRR
jgi:hypothetical protein